MDADFRKLNISFYTNQIFGEVLDLINLKKKIKLTKCELRKCIDRNKRKQQRKHEQVAETMQLANSQNKSLLFETSSFCYVFLTIFVFLEGSHISCYLF